MSTYSQIYIQVVFAVKNRESLIKANWEERLYKYITGFIKNNQQKLIAINGTENHVHIFLGINTSCRLSDLIRELKKASNNFINENNLCSGRFSWQEGFGAFSYSRSEIDNVVRYIQNQKQHHLRNSFKDEFLDYLEKNEIQYKEEYLPDWNE